LDRVVAGESRLAARLARVGLRAAQLKSLFEEVSANPDVRYVAPRVPPPTADEVRKVRVALEELLDDSLRLLPEEEPAAGWDGLQRKIRALRFSRFFPGWRSDANFLDALAQALGSKNEVTQNRWGETKQERQAAKELGQRWDDFAAVDGPARRLLDRWLAYRYPIAMRFARAAAG